MTHSRGSVYSYHKAPRQPKTVIRKVGRATASFRLTMTAHMLIHVTTSASVNMATAAPRELV
jgi:hypothetical protein